MFVLTLAFGALLGRLGRGRACLLVPIVLAGAAALGRIALAADIAWITQALWLLQGAAQFLRRSRRVGTRRPRHRHPPGQAILPVDRSRQRARIRDRRSGDEAARVVDRLPEPAARLDRVAGDGRGARWRGCSRSEMAYETERRALARRDDDGPVEQLTRGLDYVRRLDADAVDVTRARSCSRCSSSRSTCRSREQPPLATPTPTSWRASSACSSVCRPASRSCSRCSS